MAFSIRNGKPIIGLVSFSLLLLATELFFHSTTRIENIVIGENSSRRATNQREWKHSTRDRQLTLQLDEEQEEGNVDTNRLNLDLTKGDYSNEEKLVLSYTHFYGKSLPEFGYNNKGKGLTSFKNCKYKCKWSTKRSDYRKSDAVIFHLYNNLENKDFVYSKLPTRYNVDQKWILMIREPPAFYYPEQLKLLNGIFNLSMTFQSKADISIPYGGFAKRQSPPPSDFLKGRKKMVIWLASNCITSSRREKYVEQLNKFIDIDIFGECGKPVSLKYNRYMKEIGRQYLFYIAFENSDCEDYITEKFWRSLHLGMIPIVRGQRADYKKFAPPNSYIHADSFLTPQHLAEYLKELAEDAEHLNKYHKWRLLYDADYVAFTYNRRWMCDMCEQVHTAPTKTIDVYETFSETTQCFTYLDQKGRNRTGEHVEDIDRA